MYYFEVMNVVFVISSAWWVSHAKLFRLSRIRMWS